MLPARVPHPHKIMTLQDVQQRCNSGACTPSTGQAGKSSLVCTSEALTFDIGASLKFPATHKPAVYIKQRLSRRRA